jgi:hypothetical protein
MLAAAERPNNHWDVKLPGNPAENSVSAKKPRHGFPAPRT